MITLFLIFVFFQLTLQQNCQDKTQIQELTLENSGDSDQYGFSLASQSSYLAVGVPGRNAVILYARQLYGAYIYNQQITYNGGNFGYSVWLDSSFLFVGAPSSSVVQIYGYGGWNFVEMLVGNSTDNCGFSIISANGAILPHLAVGCPRGNGYVNIYQYGATFPASWTFVTLLSWNQSSTSGPVSSVGVSIAPMYYSNGASLIACGAPESNGPPPFYYSSAGVVLVFYNYVQTQVLYPPIPNANNRFGVSLVASSNFLLVGESGGNLMHLYSLTNTTILGWNYVTTLNSPQSFPVGTGLSLYQNMILLAMGNYMTAGFPSGVLLYNLNTTTNIANCTTTLIGTNTESTDQFGSSARINSPDGGITLIAAVGASNALSENDTSVITGGAVYIFCAGQNRTFCTNCTGIINRCGQCNGPLNCTTALITTGW